LVWREFYTKAIFGFFLTEERVNEGKKDVKQDALVGRGDGLLYILEMTLHEAINREEDL
jgi:hypothetical protein